MAAEPTFQTCQILLTYSQKFVLCSDAKVQMAVVGTMIMQ
jgi:hypothetical protein